MTGKGIWKARALMLLLVLALAAQACGMTAAADDAELLAMLPGQWTCDDGVELTDQEMVDTNLVLTLGENGQMSLHCTMNEGQYDYTYEGTWTSELVTEMDPETGMTDKLTLRFTSTNNPLYDGSDYGVECVYLSSYERADFDVDEAWFADHCDLVFSEGDICVYRKRGVHWKSTQN